MPCMPTVGAGCPAPTAALAIRVPGPSLLGEEVGHLDLAGDDLVGQVADLLLDLLGNLGRRIDILEGDERRADALLREALRLRPAAERAAREIADGVANADVGP